MKEKETGKGHTEVIGAGKGATVIRNKAPGVDDLNEEIMVVAHVMMMERIGRYERMFGVLIVSANNKADEILRKPLLMCPEMVYPKACNVCVWRDGDGDQCRGG